MSDQSQFFCAPLLCDTPDMVQPANNSYLDALLAIQPEGKTLNGWLVAAKVNRNFFNDLKKNASEVSPATLSKLLDVAQVSLSEFYALLENGLPHRPDTPKAFRLRANAIPFRYEGASLDRLRDDLPIYGTALGAPRVIEGEAVEQTTLNSGEIVGYLKRPVMLNEREDVYGLHVFGNSMDPVHPEGSTIVAESKRPPRIGDDVVVYLRADGEDDDGNRARAVLVKRLLRRTGAYIELQQFNPPLTFRLPVEVVLRTDRVMTLADLLA